MGKGLTNFFVREKKVQEKTAGAAEAPASPAKAVQVREKRDEGEKIDILDSILSGKEILTTLGSEYGDFTFKYPDGADQLRVAHRRAAYLGGYPDSSYDNMRRLQFEQWATLDVLIVGKPERFSKMESWADFPDQSVVDDLYTRGSQFCGDIREKIRNARPGKPVE